MATAVKRADPTGGGFRHPWPRSGPVR